MDMDGDGDKDVVTCRAREPIIGNHILSRDTLGDGLMYESTFAYFISICKNASLKVSKASFICIICTRCKLKLGCKFAPDVF